MDKNDIASLCDEDGALDLAKADVAVTEMISLHPHLAAPGAPMVAPASAVGSSGLIGMPPRSVIDVVNVAAAPATRDRSQFLSHATHAEYEGPV